MKNIAIFAGLNLIALSALLQPTTTAVINSQLSISSSNSDYQHAEHHPRARREDGVKPINFIELIMGIFDTLQFGRKTQQHINNRVQ